MIKRTIYYDSTKKMPLTAYKLFLETQETKYFSSKQKYNKECEKAQLAFFDDLITVSENREVIDRFVKINEIEKLKGKYNVCMMIIHAIRNMQPYKKVLEDFVSELEKWNYKLDRNKELFGQLDKIENRLQGILTKVEQLQSEFEVAEEKKAQDIDKQLNFIENTQEKKYRLKAEDLTVYEFIMLLKECQEIIRRRNGGN